MRTVSIAIHNSQKIEIFVEKRKACFEVWIVGVVGNRRVVLSHDLTHDDLEAGLEYARAGDLDWRDAARSELPSKTHPVANEAADNIRRRVFADFEKFHQSIAYHVTGIINVLPIDRKEWNIAKKAILGQWTDKIATVNFQIDSKLKWSCPLDRPHPFNSGARIDGYIPDWWSFASWQLHLLNREKKIGMRIAVIRVDEQELHISSDDNSGRLVCIFRKVK